MPQSWSTLNIEVITLWSGKDMSLRILLADDSAYWREALRESLEEEPGWTVFEANNGSDAVQRSNWVHPDVAVLDFCMPELDGLSAARELKRREPNLPIVMVTIDKSEMLEKEARRAGVLAVFSKTDYMQVRVFVDRTIHGEQGEASVTKRSH